MEMKLLKEKFNFFVEWETVEASMNKGWQVADKTFCYWRKVCSMA
jgi:hypothetical protein